MSRGCYSTRQRNPEHYAAHDVTELEVFARTVLVSVVAFDAGRSDRIVSVNGGKVLGLAQRFLAVVVLTLVVDNELEARRLDLRFRLVLFVHGPHRQERV